MAGIGKYKKGAKFTLKSGNTPLFKQMGSGTPLYNTASVSTTSETTTSSTESEKEKDNEEEQVPVTPEKVPVTPDKPLAKAGKVMFNALAGGLNAIQKNKIKELKINFDKNEEKRKEEANRSPPSTASAPPKPPYRSSSARVIPKRSRAFTSAEGSDGSDRVSARQSS